ncbi:MAG: hypothetical protein AAF696_28765 [Bacteroidota bacterium]
MNLEELKEIWDLHADQLGPDRHFEKAEIHLMLQKRSRGALSKINRNIFLELAACALLGIGVVYWLWTRKETVSNWEIWGFSLLFLFTGFFYYFKYKSINREEIQKDNLLENLEYLTQKMGTYMRLYLYSVIFLVPTLAFSGGYYGLYIRRLSLESSEPILSGKAWFFFGAGMLLYAILAVLVTNWYLRKVYGTHYRELKACLTELQEL